MEKQIDRVSSLKSENTRFLIGKSYTLSERKIEDFIKHSDIEIFNDENNNYFSDVDLNALDRDELLYLTEQVLIDFYDSSLSIYYAKKNYEEIKEENLEIHEAVEERLQREYSYFRKIYYSLLTTIFVLLILLLADI